MKKVTTVIFNKKTNVIGVQFSERNITMIEISGDIEQPVIDNYAITYLEDGVIKDGDIVNQDTFVQQLMITWKKLGTKNKNVAIALSMDNVLIKEDSFSTIFNDEETYLQVENAIAKNVSSNSIEDLYIDYAVTGISGELQNIYMVAAKKEMLNPIIDIFERAHLNVMVVDLNGHVIERAIQKVINNPNETYTLVNIHDKETLLHVMHNGEVIFDKSLDHNISTVIHQISQNYGVSYNDALKTLLNMDEKIEGEYWLPFLDGVAVDIRKALQFYMHSDKPQGAKSEITEIFFAGHEANLPSFINVMNERLSRNCQIMNPLATSTPGEKIADLTALVHDSSLLISSFGLALRSFDLLNDRQINMLPWRQYIREAKKKSFTNAMVVAGITGVVVALGQFYLESNILTGITADNDKIQQGIDKKKNEIKLIDEIKENKKILLKRQKIVENLQKNKYEFINLINFISSNTTPDIRLKEIDRNKIDNKRIIKIVGVSLNNSIIADYVRRLSDPIQFDNVRIISINKVTLPNGVPGSEFTLEATYDMLKEKEAEKATSNADQKEPAKETGLIDGAKKILDNAKKIKTDASEVK